VREQNYKKGFSLIEVIVVMSIISILSLIGIGAFLAARDDAMINADADQIISRIRDYQNRSMAVAQASAANNTRAWGFKLDGSNRQMEAKWLDNTPALNDPSSPDDINLNSALTYYSCPGGACTLVSSSTPLYLFYGTPFANTIATTDTNVCIGNPAGGCSWQNKAEYPKNSYIDSQDIMKDASGQLDPASFILIQLDYKNRMVQVKVRSNGDASIQ